jgi:hypothetical protein
METCYDYFDCTKTECTIQKNKKLKCWEVEDTLCDTHNNDLKLLQKLFESKKEYCELCFYYQTYNKE